jgi:hypothetical protein
MLRGFINEMKKRNKHIGSSLEDFLKEEGVLEETRAVALKETLAWQVQQAMEKEKIRSACAWCYSQSRNGNRYRKRTSTTRGDDSRFREVSVFARPLATLGNLLCASGTQSTPA